MKGAMENSERKRSRELDGKTIVQSKRNNIINSIINSTTCWFKSTRRPRTTSVPFCTHFQLYYVHKKLTDSIFQA